MSVELNIDGLVGPTHNYAGLSFGNIASSGNKGAISNPKAAALQGLQKMRTLVNMGLPQAVMPPHARPLTYYLRGLGFNGTDSAVHESAWKANPALVANLMSASPMWTANAATVSPSIDTADGKVHLTAANLVAMPHRSIEAPQTERLLQAILPKAVIHPALPSNTVFGDEGAANHNRMSQSHGDKGLEIFVYGREALSDEPSTKFPGRQTLEASKAVGRLHGLDEAATLYLRQSAKAIDAGAFHNDVVCVTNGTVMFFHKDAFDDVAAMQNVVREKAKPLGFEPEFLMADIPLEDTIQSYLFNSQLLSLPNGKMGLILPKNVENTPSAKAFVDHCIAGNNPVSEAHYLDLKQSMQNGGGPACLRLRVPLTDEELKQVHSPMLMDEAKLQSLDEWVNKYYREALSRDDLGDPALMIECRTALDDLTQRLSLGSIYDFQMEGGAQ
ncbi:succinylarginine dihydrolase [Litorimonas taeanensis]|uniref:N-succinylarginine dihydrolase n=1 Tax=Litorimonas taeanensis TaxID=568099 RepID=A0A420WEC9_9PROT|nr:N-succinylarginine dihydrolase [Litorimonas taeanensis]RKQ69387.1 succinylarginine dihydrolase [Litorimonas taeanensis]